MNAMLGYIITRLREPSTYAGLGPLLTAIGWQIQPDKWLAISTACMGICGAIAVFLGDSKK